MVYDYKDGPHDRRRKAERAKKEPTSCWRNFGTRFSARKKLYWWPRLQQGAGKKRCEPRMGLIFFVGSFMLQLLCSRLKLQLNEGLNGG